MISFLIPRGNFSRVLNHVFVIFHLSAVTSSPSKPSSFFCDSTFTSVGRFVAFVFHPSNSHPVHPHQSRPIPNRQYLFRYALSNRPTLIHRQFSTGRLPVFSRSKSLVFRLIPRSPSTTRSSCLYVVFPFFVSPPGVYGPSALFGLYIGLKR